MKKTRPIFRLRQILSYKHISRKKYEEAYEILSEIKESHPIAYHNYLGKFLLTQGKIEEAKNNFLIELSLNPQSVSAHYNLYKIGIIEGDYQDAHGNLKFYKENINKEEVNLELPLTMIKFYLNINDYDKSENDNYQVEKTDTFVITKIEDEEALTLYNRVISDFNSKNFINLKKDLNKLKEAIDENNIKIEVDTLIKITEDITKKTNYEKNKLNRLVDIKEILRNIDILCDKDPNIAKEKLQTLKETRYLRGYSLQIKYLENKIKEKQLYNNLSDKKKEYYNICIENGRKAYKEGNYEEALVCYKTGAIVTKHPIFNYYIGKIYYKKHKIRQAKEKLLEYERVGGEKLSKTYLYLSHIYNVMRKKEEKRKAYLNLEKIETTYNMNNFLKFKASKKQNCIDMDEFDFFEEETKTNFGREIERIKKLYIRGNTKQADKLLTQLEISITDKKDKEEIKTLSKNKILYKNKNR